MHKYHIQLYAPHCRN